MERATDPELIEEAQHILREYCEELKLDSISIFGKDGMLFYSSDPFMEQQEDVKGLFQVLEEYVTDFILGVPYFLMVYDSSICLILKPIYVGDWRGSFQGWYLALGSSSEIRCKDISENMISYMAKAKRADFSTNPEYHRRLETLQLAFDFPQILGMKFEKNDETTVLLDSDSGLIYQRYNGVPMFTRFPTYRDWPILIQRLHDLSDYFHYEKWRILTPPIEPKKHSIRSDDLAKYFIIYSLILCILAIGITPLILFILFITFIPGQWRGGGISYGIAMSIGAVLFMTTGLIMFFETLMIGYLFFVLIGIHFLLSAIIVVRKGRNTN